MAEFYNLWKSKDVVVQELEALIQDAEENEGLERHSAQKIQQVFRGQTVRSYVTAQRLAASCISRIFRGHMGRRDAAKANRGKMRKERMAVFHYHALLVQKYFRGFYSRRYYHDFFARKAYIQSVVVKSNALREKLATQLERQRREEEDKKAAENHEEFKKVTQNLHHLVSTTATPGIYKSPYMQDQIPTAFGIPIEEHLCRGVKDILRTKQMKQSTIKKAVYTKPVEDRRSVQATSKYGVVQDASRMEAKYSKMQHLEAKSFLAGGFARELHDYTNSVDQGTNYMDKWKNPYSQRGIPNGPADVDPRTTTLGKYPKLPFYTAVGGNKSTALPNDRFDVMHSDAFETKF